MSWQSAPWSAVVNAHHTLYIFGCVLLFKLYYRLWHELFSRYENSFSIAYKVSPPKKRKLSLLMDLNVYPDPQDFLSYVWCKRRCLIEGSCCCFPWTDTVIKAQYKSPLQHYNPTYNLCWTQWVPESRNTMVWRYIIWNKINWCSALVLSSLELCRVSQRLFSLNALN